MNELPKNILYLEDDPDFQLYISAILSDFANIKMASTIKEARAAIAKKKYDLVLVDFTLPDGSGSEIVIELAKQHPSVPVIVFSAHEITDSMINVKHVFVKGKFVEQDLTDAVRELCS